MISVGHAEMLHGATHTLSYRIPIESLVIGVSEKYGNDGTNQLSCLGLGSEYKK